MSMGKRDVGTVYSMPTRCGLCYLQQIGGHPVFGDAVAAFVDKDRNEFRFSILFPVGAAARRQVIKRLYRAPIPERYQSLGFRYPVGPIAKCIGWMIVEGERQVMVPTLTPEQAGYVLAYAINDTQLEELIYDGWTEGQPFPF